MGAIGEFDVAILVDQYAGTEASHNLYPHWRGGYYYAARPKGDPAAPLALLYVSRWSSRRESGRVCRHLRSVAGANDTSTSTR